MAMIQDSLIRDAISSLGSVMALLAATLVAMAIAGIFKELSGMVRAAWRVLCRKAKRKSL
jgi:hypothetical protein